MAVAIASSFFDIPVPRRMAGRLTGYGLQGGAKHLHHFKHDKSFPVFFCFYPRGAVLGEVDLSGRLRDVGQLEQRLAEVAQLGHCDTGIVPKGVRATSP